MLSLVDIQAGDDEGIHLIHHNGESKNEPTNQGQGDADEEHPCRRKEDELRLRFNPMEDYTGRFYFTRGDGNGPTRFWLVDEAAE